MQPPPLPGSPPGQQAEGSGSAGGYTLTQSALPNLAQKLKTGSPSVWMRIQEAGWQAGLCAHPVALIATRGKDGPDHIISAEDLRLLSNYMSKPDSLDPWLFQ